MHTFATQNDGKLWNCMFNIASINCMTDAWCTPLLPDMTGVIAAVILTLGIASIVALLLYVVVVYRHRLRSRGECAVRPAAACCSALRMLFTYLMHT